MMLMALFTSLPSYRDTRVLFVISLSISTLASPPPNYIFPPLIFNLDIDPDLGWIYYNVYDGRLSRLCCNTKNVKAPNIPVAIAIMALAGLAPLYSFFLFVGSGQHASLSDISKSLPNNARTPYKHTV